MGLAQLQVNLERDRGKLLANNIVEVLFTLKYSVSILRHLLYNPTQMISKSAQSEL